MSWPLLLAACAHPALRPFHPVLDTITLPEDHGPHPWAQTEWWHVHADLLDVDGQEPVALFCGFVVQRTQRDWVGPIPVSPFVDPAHVALSRVEADGRAWATDRVNFPDLPTAHLDHDALDLRHGRSGLTWDQGVFTLTCGAGPHRFDLVIEPTRPAVLPGDDGRVTLHSDAVQGWTQLERAEVRGKWTRGSDTRWVEGLAFVKHQWGTIYDPNVDGFEWISADLPDGRGLSIGWLAADGSRGVPGSLAFWSHPDGTVDPIPASDLSVTVTGTWRSRRSATTWPVAWRVVGPDLDLEVTSSGPNPEIWAFPASITASPATARGWVGGVPVDAPAYVEAAGMRPQPLRFLFSTHAP